MGTDDARDPEGQVSPNYSYSEAYNASLEYFHGNDLAAKVFVDKYAVRDKNDRFVEKTPDDMHLRLAQEFARVDESYGMDYEKSFNDTYNAIKNFSRIVPQGSPMAAVGNSHQLMSASNCVVVESPDDSIAGIFRTATELAQLYKRRCGVGTDISTLRPDGMQVNNAARTTSGAWSFADFFSYVTRMIGQCIAKGERVLTKDGLKAIEDVSSQDSVWTKKGWVSVTRLVNNGTKNILKLQTSEGFSIRASKDHVFLTEDDGTLLEKKLGDFEPGDSIVLIPGNFITKPNQELIPPKYIKKLHNNSNKLNEDVFTPLKLNDDLAYLLGQMYGDGSVEYDKFGEPTVISIACSHGHPLIREKVCNIVRSLFGYEPVVKPGDGAVDKVEIHSKVICHWLQLNGILKSLSSDIRVPSSIISSPSSVQMSFLAGFFDADGTNGRSKKGYAFNTTSLPFARDLQVLLMANGIVSKRHEEDRSHNGWKTLYSVMVTGTHAQEELIQHLEGGVFGAVKIYEKFISKRDNCLTPYKAKTLGVSHNKYSYIPDNSQYVSASAYNKLKKAEENCANDELLITASIQSIVEDGEEETFDLVLPEEHLFWCEGFYVHNSGRRGALMITMDVHHPDIVKFSTMKQDLTKVTGANVSVRLSNEFLQAVENGSTYEQRWPCEGTPVYSKQVDACTVWKTIIDSATNTAEPGLIIWDNMLNNLPAHCYPEFKTISTNPCSEIALSAYDSCRLISLNLTAYVKNPFELSSSFDWDLFVKDVQLAMRMADNLVDIELGLISKIIDICKDDDEKALWQKLRDAGANGRRTGLGTHGLADCLAMLCLKYDSDQAVQMVDAIYERLRNTAYETSTFLAETRGPFPLFDYEKEKNCNFIKRLPVHILDQMKKHGRRNIAILTQAPTGSISLLSKVGCFNRYSVSSGVESVWRLMMTRRKKINSGDDDVRVDFVDQLGDKWQEFDVFHNNVLNYLDVKGHDVTPDDIVSGKYTLPSFFVTSDQIDWKQRIAIQAAEQQYIDHSISSTINLPKNTSSAVVGELYLSAWKKGLKGVTVYVDGCRDGVLISKEDEKDEQVDTPTLNAPRRPETLISETHKIKVDFGDGELKNTYITVSFFPESRRPYEIFIQAPHQCLSDEKDLQILELTARNTSMNLRHGVPILYICEQLDKVGGQYIFSIPTNVSRILRKYINEPEENVTSTDMERHDLPGAMKCPSCSARTYILSEGCGTCSSCGYSGCS